MFFFLFCLLVWWCCWVWRESFLREAEAGGIGNGMVVIVVRMTGFVEI